MKFLNTKIIRRQETNLLIAIGEAALSVRMAVFGKLNCYGRSQYLATWLGFWNIPAEICYAVRHDGANFLGHCWVEIESPHSSGNWEIIHRERNSRHEEASRRTGKKGI